MERHHPGGIAPRTAGRKDKDCRSGDQRSDKRESHGTPPFLVASGDVRQEEKIKTAGLETGDPLEEEPAGCQRSDKRESHGTPPFPDALRGRDLRPGGIC
jgi:hypothetical protein